MIKSRFHERQKFGWSVFAKREVVANIYFSTLGHSISSLTYFQVEERCGDHLASLYNALGTAHYLSRVRGWKYLQKVL